MRAARRAGVFAVLLLAGCGRIGYGAPSSDDAGRESDGGAGLDGSAGPDGSAAPDGGAALDGGPCTEATYGGHAYAICGTSLTWPAAQAVCTARGMHLVRVDDADEHTFVDALVTGPARALLWIGASDRALEDTWSWEDGTVFYVDAETGGMTVGGAFVGWGSAEPNGRSRENCAAIESHGVWIDLDCSQPGAAVCESP